MKITKEMKKTKEFARREIKLLLLGTGEAGKSTVIKQMRIIHGKEFADEKSRAKWVQSVRENVLESIHILLRNLEKLDIPLGDRRNQEHATRVMDAAKKHYDASAVPEVFRAIAALWQDEGIRECYRRRAEFRFIYLSDSSKYFLDQVTVLADPKYVPTQQDILRVRKSSTGVQEYEFTVKGCSFRVVDVGGQRSERRKWIHCFENVNAMIFVASLSDFDQELLDKTANNYEDRTVNRMEESLALFNVVIQDRFLQTASIILLLNKTDIFQEKLQERDLADYFPDYAHFQPESQPAPGPKKDPQTAGQYVLSKYMAINDCHVAGKSASSSTEKDEQGKVRRPQPNTENEQLMFSHFTCATDTKNMKFIAKAVEDRLLQEALIDFNLALV
ncbi:Guanine nucleotide-binding protein G(q) subunit alpha [Hypsibius exemplaris]|uniref:Guanine nucleotide-binding protein G(Q) subunit alpha n=1 Tax=Hypsibius exemplaris TaxID=2072580 RepID=A0A1W0X3T7_HYPEX|nr:Guanine nucleotide-binding protein G(q) subunit alpha [Hypsibius exemplaris]